MEIIQIIGKPPIEKDPLVLVIGKFDGVHKGHQLLLQTAKQIVKEKEKLAVLSFSSHPLWILRQDHKFLKQLTPEQEKLKHLKMYGVEKYFRVLFTKEYAEITAKEFVLEHLVRLNISHIIVGEQFLFGKEKEGTTTELIALCKQINIKVTVIPLMIENGRKISSTIIRSYVEAGQMEAAQGLLGYPFRITGKVIHGKALGRKLGFPTVNLGHTEFYVEPKSGVYLGGVEIIKNDIQIEYWHALINAGYRPTVNGKEFLVEAYLINFNGDLYGKAVTVSFSRYLREEVKYEGLDPLVEQMNRDLLLGKSILGLS